MKKLFLKKNHVMQKVRFGEIICFGEVLWDMFPHGPQPGGAPLNVAIHLKKQEKEPLLISSVGNDQDGRDLLKYLSGQGLNTTYIQTSDHLPTGKVLVSLNESGNATYEICEPVAWDEIKLNPDIEQTAGNADLIIFGTLASRNPVTRNTLLELLDNSDALRLCDINLRPPYTERALVEHFIHLSDMVKMNREELETIASWHGKNGKLNGLINWFSEYYNCPEVCITRGAQGAVLLKEDQIFEHPGYPVITADTVGAGDSFLAALVAGLSEFTHPQRALEFACATGAFVASQKGAVPEYRKTDILEIIAKSFR